MKIATLVPRMHVVIAGRVATNVIHTLVAGDTRSAAMKSTARVSYSDIPRISSLRNLDTSPCVDMVGP